MQVSEMWIPIVMFVGLAVVLSLWVWFRYRAKRDTQVTIRTAIEKGQELSGELIENLVNGQQPAIDRSNHFRLPAHNPAFGFGRRQVVKRQRLSKGADHLSRSDILVLNHLSLLHHLHSHHTRLLCPCHHKLFLPLKHLG